MNLRVAHLTHNAQGGGGRAGLRARDACRAAGMISELFSLDGATPDQDIIQPKWLRKAPDAVTQYQEVLLNNVQWGDIASGRRGESNTLLSQPYPGMDIERFSALNSFDVLHLHWVTWTVTPPDIKRWLDSGRALVWTMHDAWPMTGGCHYPSGCDQYLTECIVCPQLNDHYGVVPNAFADKLRQYGNDPRLKIIAPSQWLADEARKSRILRDCAISHIENPIELDVFAPKKSRDSLRKELGFDEHDVVFIFGNHLNEEVRKGGAFLREALKSLLTSPDLLEEWRIKGIKPALLTFGTPVDLGPMARGIKTLSIDSVDDDAVLVDLYNVADVLLFPSIEDNYPNTIIEAAACGTPSIVFKTGGMATMVLPGKTGLVVDEPGDSTGLAAAMVDFGLHWFNHKGMRKACRKHVEELNSPLSIGTRLQEVYRDAMAAVGAPSKVPANLPSTPGAVGGGISDTAKAIHKFSTIGVSPRIGADFLRHPLNRRLAKIAVDKGDARVTQAMESLRDADCVAQTVVADHRTSVALASALHSHHASYAGPYQFTRHLDPQQWEVRHYRTPLGADLAGPSEAALRASAMAKVMGLAGYVAQPNAMVAEFDLLNDAMSTRFDVVHFVDGELCGWLFPRAAKRLLGSKAPATVMSLHQPPELLGDMITVERLRDIDIVLALCEDQADFLRSYAPDIQVRVIPHGISTEFFRPHAEQRRTFVEPSVRPLRLLGVGHWLRNYPMAIGALERLNELGVPCEYTIVCHNFPRDGALPPNAKVVTGLSDDELLQCYRDADALLLPMAAATANNAILESMASGLPVFSSNVGGLAEMTGGAAFLAEPGDVEALAQGLKRAAENPDIRSNMMAAGLAQAESLSWANVSKKFAAVYQEAIEIKRHRHG